MKKTLASVLTTALVVGAASTTFAAANPFSDVPAGHWAYDAVAQLAADGVIEGYGDNTFRGDQSITRYEMAQMVAKAMAKNPSGVDKAMLDRLAAEFREELNNLGVRVANLEKHADKVQWTGKVEYTYHNYRIERIEGQGKEKDHTNGYVFRLEPKAEVNDHWTVNARLDAEGDLKHDTTTNVALKRVWAQGDYGKFQIKLGRMELYPNSHGLLFDTEYSGGEVTYGDKFKATLRAGRLKDDKIYAGDVDAGVLDSQGHVRRLDANDPTSFFGLDLQYDAGGKGVFGGLGYYYLKDDDFKEDYYNRDTNTNKASIITANLGYRFSDRFNLTADYARNSKATFEKTSWQAILDYGTYKNAKVKGSWDVYAGYRKYGYNTSLIPTEDEAIRGAKGFVIGAAWAPFKNVGLLVKYFNGKNNYNGRKAEQLFGRVEFFF